MFIANLLDLVSIKKVSRVRSKIIGGVSINLIKRIKIR